MRKLVLVSLIGALGCVDGSPLSKINLDDDQVYLGGELTIESCGYKVVTRADATAPIEHAPVFGDDPTPKHVHLGFQGDPSTSMVVQWRTKDDRTLASIVEYGEGSKLDQRLEGISFEYRSGIGANDQRMRIHEGHLCGLLPDTQYSYRVGGTTVTGEEHWSPTYTFRTAPEPSDTSAEIVVAMLGDSRGGYDVWQTMLDVTKGFAPDLIMLVGDATTIGALQEEWEIFFDEAEPLFATTPVVSAHGNHDVNSINYYSQFVMPGDEEDYAFRYGPMQAVVLNDTPFEASNIQGKSRDLLDATMGATNAPWKVLMHHQPIWSASTKHGSDEVLKNSWGPIIDKHGVDLVVSGHDHNYERTKPMRGDAVQASAAEGTVYLVTGSAGADLYGNGSDFWTDVSEKAYSTVRSTFTSSMFEMTAYRDDGSVLDSYAIAK